MNSLLFQKTLEKSKSTKELFRGRLNPISNREIEFKKINDYILPNTNGEPAEILYIKDNLSHTSLYNFNVKNSGGFISDGGLKKKYNKYNVENSYIHNKSTGKYNSINSSKSNNKSLNKDIFSKSMKNIRKNIAHTPLYESKNNSIKKNKLYSSSSRSAKNIFSLKKKMNKNIKYNNKNVKEKIKKEKENNQKKNEEEEEEKYEKMNQLIENKIASYIRDLQNKKKPTLEEERNEKKQKILAENGIEIRIDSTIDDEDPKEEDENNYENEKIEEEKLSSNNLNSSKNFVKSKRAISPKKNNYILDKEDNNKKIYKPKIDCLEYINILKNLHSNNKKNPLNKSHSTKNIYKNNLNNSFRNSNKKKISPDKNSYEKCNRKNQRKEEEIKKIEKFIKKKKEITKKN